MRSEQRCRSSYEAFLNENSAGVCHYKLDSRTITFTHTVVDPAFEGKGIGSALAKHVLNDSRAQGLTVVPACKFIASVEDETVRWEKLIQTTGLKFE